MTGAHGDELSFQLRNLGRRPSNVTSFRNRGPSPLSPHKEHEPHAETNTPSNKNIPQDVETPVRSGEALATASAWNVTVGNDREQEPVAQHQLAVGIIQHHRLRHD